MAKRFTQSEINRIGPHVLKAAKSMTAAWAEIKRIELIAGVDLDNSHTALCELLSIGNFNPPQTNVSSREVAEFLKLAEVE